MCFSCQTATSWLLGVDRRLTYTQNDLCVGFFTHIWFSAKQLSWEPEVVWQRHLFFWFEKSNKQNCCSTFQWVYLADVRWRPCCRCGRVAVFRTFHILILLMFHFHHHFAGAGFGRPELYNQRPTVDVFQLCSRTGVLKETLSSYTYLTGVFIMSRCPCCIKVWNLIALSGSNIMGVNLYTLSLERL